MSSPFDVPLVSDPAVALPPISLSDLPKIGPLYTVEYVIELVGPKSIPAAAVTGLLQADWQSALGNPGIWVMAAMDQSWKAASSSAQGSFDSLALTWEYLSGRGNLSSASAAHLLSVAEKFGQAVERRAMPIPPPQDVDRQVRALAEARDALDIGFSLAVANAQGWMLEKDIWVQCARLGLTLGGDGVFGWQVQGWPEPLVSVTPLGRALGFSLGAVQRGDAHAGIGIGFSVPLSPSPSASLDACFHIARVFAQVFTALILDEEGHPLTIQSESMYRRNIGEAERSLEQAGLKAGSAEAAKLFG